MNSKLNPYSRNEVNSTMQTGTKKSTIKRGTKRANYEEQKINDILDASYLCHVGFAVEGEAKIIPTAYVRMDDALYFHGHRQNGMLQALVDGQTACVTVTILDGMVLARSAFHHSVNYRSVVLFGRGEVVVGGLKTVALDALTNHFVPGRSTNIRPHHQKELDATLVVKWIIDEASAKIRTGPPVDNENDYQGTTWAGVLPLKTVIGEIQPCPRLADNIPVPAHVLKVKTRL